MGHDYMTRNQQMSKEEKSQKTKCQIVHGGLDIVYDRPLRKFVHTFAFLLFVMYISKETTISQQRQQQQHQQNARFRRHTSHKTKTPKIHRNKTSGTAATEKVAIASCDITDPDALSSIRRAQSYRCKQLFMNIACASREDETVPDKSVSVGTCPNPDLDLSKILAPLKTKRHNTAPPIAFVIISAGRGARQIGQLLRVLYRKQNIYVVLVHRSNNYLSRTLRDMTAKHRNINIEEVAFDLHWANPLRFRMLYLTLGKLLKLHSSWQHVVMMEGNDFPVRSVDELINYLTHYRDKSFIFTERANLSFTHALGLHHLFVECEGRAWRVGTRELPIGLKIGVGYSRMILARNLVTYFVKGSDQFISNMRAYWTFSLNPFESFFQTLALNTAFCERVIPTSPFWRLMSNESRSCDCQDQHLFVDWCSCARGASANVKCCFPYVHGQEDVPELLNIVKNQVEKPLFFATKFDSLISQSAINKIHIDVHGKIKTNSRGLDRYWYNVYHHLDKIHTAGDSAITYFRAFARMTLSMSSEQKSLILHKLLEVHALFEDDVMRGFLVKFEVKQTSSTNRNSRRIYVIESYVQQTQLTNIRSRVVHDSPLLKRLRDVKVTSNYSPNNLTFDPLGALLGPFSVIDYVTTWAEGSISGNFSAIFYDSTREMVAVYHVTVPLAPYRHNVRTDRFRRPLRPGWWVVRYYDGQGEFYEPFLVLPLSRQGGQPIRTAERARRLHGGPEHGYLDGDYGLLKPSRITAARLEAANNAKKSGDELRDWIDQLIVEQWTVKDVCHPERQPYPDWLDSSVCQNTNWSSYGIDIKSRVE